MAANTICSDLGAQKTKSDTVYTVSPSICREGMGSDDMLLVFWMLSLKPTFFFFSFIFISWRLITSQHFSGFCHTLTWISRGVTCIPLPDPPSHLPFHPIPLGLPSAPGPSPCLMHPFSLSSFTFIKRLFTSSSFSAIRVVSSVYWGYWYFSQQSWFQLVLHPARHFVWCTLHIS